MTTTDAGPAVDTQATDPKDQTILDLQASLSWAMRIIQSAPSAADICPWHGRTPFPHVCGYYTNPEWLKAQKLLQSPILSDVFSWSSQLSLPPNSGQVRSNTGDWIGATRLRIEIHNGAGTDVSLSLLKIKTGDTIRLQHNTVPTRWAEFRVSAPLSSAATYFDYPVIYSDGAGLIPNSGTNIAVTLTGNTP